ncbi:MAG TPA: DUF362 domain-containing protein [Thermodesulfobacteriota bacterium]|nr:DUF362 domain-containing protein [Thermodesulfobacteriota bacterium]
MISRRNFLKAAAVAGGTSVLGMQGGLAMASGKSKVTIVKTEDRKQGVTTLLRQVKGDPVKGKEVLIKPNFNTADPAPGSTHNDTLAAMVEELWKMGAKKITIGDRSYPPTVEVMEQKKVVPGMKKLGVEISNFDDLKEKDWVEFKPKGSHWPNGFRIARPVLEAEYLISTGCLKTHQYGGIFTLSLKLHVGVVPTSRQGFDYMRQLHGSADQRRMIAEINQPFTPNLVIMDGVEAFVDGGPATGKRAAGNVLWSSDDRVAVDAAGVAMLKILGSNDKIMKRGIFEQEQIARAAELGLGASSPSDIEVIPADDGSREFSRQVADMLGRG